MYTMCAARKITVHMNTHYSNAIRNIHLILYSVHCTANLHASKTASGVTSFYIFIELFACYFRKIAVSHLILGSNELKPNS
jgi:hypothetical protein